MNRKILKGSKTIYPILIILFLIGFTSSSIIYANEISLHSEDVSLIRNSIDESFERGVEHMENDKLTDEEGKYLLDVARKTIEQRLFNKKEKDQGDEGFSPKFPEQRGTFVTLTIEKGLRGCIGHIIPQESLIEGIRINAINAAFRDPRFPPLSKKEWDKIEIEISILTEPKPLPYEDREDLLKKLRKGIDGVILKKGYHQATFLPQVWDQLPDKKEFLGHLCMKAGLNEYAWRDEKLEVMTYQVQAFEEEEHK